MKKLFRLHNKRLSTVSSILLIASFVLVACSSATATPTTAPVPTSAPTTAAQATTAPTSAPTAAAATEVATTAATSAATEAATAAATTAATAAATEAATQGSTTPASGELRVAMQAPVQTDPAQISSDSEVMIANAVYDYLVDVDAKSQIQPRLATKWDISADGKVYTFTLASGVTFQDGSAFSSADVVWTFNRLRDATQKLPTADLYKNIANVAAAGDGQVVFTLTNPNPFFLFDLSDNHALVVKANTTDFTKFNGTGPFTVSNYSPEDRIELAANAKYFIPGEPKLAKLTIIFFKDENASVDALRGGQVDLVPRLSAGNFVALQSETGITTVNVPTNGFSLIRLRADTKPGNDPRVMQAMKLATDRSALLNLVQQNLGAIGRDSPIGPLYPTYYSEDTPLPTRDITQAKQLLADAGYASGLKLDLYTPDTIGQPDLAAALKSQWADAGITLNIIVEPESVYYGDNGWLSVDLGITGWGSRPYPQFYLDTMLKTGAVWNEAHWSDPEFDKLEAEAGTTQDEATRIADYKQIQKIMIERGPVIIPYFFPQLAAIKTSFTGFELKAFAGRTDFRTVSAGQ
jgi:peptide/nickel transport system substrate-binding protein